MPYRPPILTILEGKWFVDKNVTVLDLVKPLFTVWTPRGDAAHHYEMFTNEAAFCDAIRHAFDKGQASTIYIAAHGSASEIFGFHDNGISRTKIKNALKAVDGVKARGVYFGSCEFATRKNAEFILEECDRVSWLAGYTTYVDWIDSSVLDLYFLRHMLFPSPGKGNKKPTTQLERATLATKRICQEMGPLAKRTQFHVYIRKSGPNFGVRDLVEEFLADA